MDHETMSLEVEKQVCQVTEFELANKYLCYLISCPILNNSYEIMYQKLFQTDIVQNEQNKRNEIIN